MNLVGVIVVDTPQVLQSLFVVCGEGRDQVEIELGVMKQL